MKNKDYVLKLLKAIDEIVENKDWFDDKEKIAELHDLADELKTETDLNLMLD